MNLVGLLSIAGELARSLAALKIRVQPHGPTTSLVSPRNVRKEVDRLPGTQHGVQRRRPTCLAACLTQVATTDGQHTTAGAQYEHAHSAILAWTQSKGTDRGTNELTAERADAHGPDVRGHQRARTLEGSGARAVSRNEGRS